MRDDPDPSAEEIAEVVEPGAFRWIAESLRGPVGEQPRGDHLRTLDLIPPSFESYAKVLHPVYRDEREEAEDGWQEPSAPRARWAEVPREFGVPFDASLPASMPREWPPHLSVAYEGSIPPSVLAPLVRVLDRTDAPPTYFWWWGVVAMFGFGRQRRDAGEDVLCRGPLRVLPSFLADHRRPSPTYWWPSDRTWCIATDWDLCFTMVGGTATTIRRLLAEPEIEGFEVAANDVLLRYSKLRPAEG